MFPVYKYAVKRRTIKTLMDNHNYTRQQARLAWSKVTDEMIHTANTTTGVNIEAIDPSSILKWIQDNWQTILKVALSIVSVILMFADQPPNATNLPPTNTKLTSSFTAAATFHQSTDPSNVVKLVDPPEDPEG